MICRSILVVRRKRPSVTGEVYPIRNELATVKLCSPKLKIESTAPLQSNCDVGRLPFDSGT